MDNEEKYLDIRDKLKNLEQVKASDNFVHNLHSKIVEIESEKRHEHEARFDKGKGGFLRNLFGNMQYPWLVPAAGFTVLIFFVFYITFLNKNASENKQELLSTQKQETIEQKNVTPEEDNKSPAVTEEDNTLKNKEKLPGKDIAGDLKTEKNLKAPSPVKTADRENYKSEPKTFREETKKKADEVSDGMVGEETKSESGKSKDSEKDQISTSQLSVEKSGTTDDQNSKRGILSEEKAKTSRIREKIDSLGKLDLEKLRKEILK